MSLNHEQIKSKIAEAIEKRFPVSLRPRGRYIFWFDKHTHTIHCGWGKMLHLQSWQPIVYACIFDPTEGLTQQQWEDIAEKFKIYFID